MSREIKQSLSEAEHRRYKAALVHLQKVTSLMNLISSSSLAGSP